MSKNHGIQIGGFLARLDDSRAFSLFCERVYGLDLLQMNRMDAAQFTKLLELLDLSSNDLVLDLGCGLGTITEYISDVTQARLVGIDIAVEAIKRAQSRTKEKWERLEFYETDFNDLSFQLQTFTGIIAIDSLYDDCVDDLEQTLSRLKALLKPQGQMGVFYTANKAPDETADLLDPKKTYLAQALDSQGLEFQTWEFTENECHLLETKKEVAGQLEEEFRLEGNQDICEKTIKHSEKLLQRIKRGNARRFLYYVKS
ncbi:MAG: class I SAM-dependent methyltransferase [Candidatus Hodarchaeota archaeon]